MRALVVEHEEGPERVLLRDVAAPPPAGLVVDVHAAGVGYPDLLMSQGAFQIRQPLPFTLGWEAAGTVASAPAATGFRVGDRVMTLTFGAHAGQIAAVPEATFPVPPGLSLEEAAAFPLNYLTAYAALLVRGRLQTGERVLVLGAAGGVGTAAIQVAKATGAHVVALVSSDEKAAVARRAGADATVLSAGRWRDEVLDVSGGGVDVAIDPVGGDAFAQTLRCMRSRGRVVVVGFASGTIPDVAVNRLLLRNVDVCGCTWGVLAETPTGLDDAVAHLTQMVADGFARPIVGARYALEDGRQALLDLARRRTIGKAVLTIAR